MSKYKTFLYIGKSMSPFFKVGDLVFVKEYHSDRPKIGDVIVFIKPGSNKKIMHRIVRITKDKIITKGDNNRDLDEDDIKIKDIIGKVIYLKRENNFIKVKKPFKINKSILKFLSLIYHFLERFNFSFIFPRLKIKYFIIYRNSKMELQLLLKRSIIARISLEEKKFLEIKPPFRLILPKVSEILDEIK